MNSITERILTAHERGFTEDMISAYEGVPVDDVNAVIETFHEPAHVQNVRDIQIHRQAQRFIERHDIDEITSRINDHRSSALADNNNPEREAVVGLVDQYRLDPEVAVEVFADVSRRERVVHLEQEDRVERNRRRVTRAWGGR
jgi:hypothetical protein